MTFLLEDPRIYRSRSQKNTLSLNSMIPTGGRQETNMGERVGIYFNLPTQKEKNLKQPLQKQADRMGHVQQFRDRFESVQLCTRHMNWHKQAFWQRLALREWMGNLESIRNSELSPRLRNPWATQGCLRTMWITGSEPCANPAFHTSSALQCSVYAYILHKDHRGYRDMSETKSLIKNFIIF